MKPKSLVRLSNIVGVVSIILLIYWVFISISIKVFGLKVFKHDITETFYMSVLAILALMSGSLMINIMFNLTRIAEKHNDDIGGGKEVRNKKTGWLLMVSFPMIFLLLFAGDYLTRHRKESLLIASAHSVIDNSKNAVNLCNYSFDSTWLCTTQNTLYILSKTDENFPRVSVVVRDTLDNTDVLLQFSSQLTYHAYNRMLDKKDFLFETTKDQRAYLHQVFSEGKKDVMFIAEDGKYQLFYPYTNNGKTIVLYFSDYQHYGKLGS